ncbi:MAG: hypothetical protein AAGC88_16105 [Bacteroidota bacterium]
MHGKDQYLGLVKTDDCHIIFCKHSRRFTLTYKCSCASLSPEELEYFYLELRTLKAGDFRHEYNGERLAVVKNRSVRADFILSKHQVAELAHSVAESLTLLDALRFGVRG